VGAASPTTPGAQTTVPTSISTTAGNEVEENTDGVVAKMFVTLSAFFVYCFASF